MMKIFQLIETTRRTTHRGKIETRRRYRELSGRETLTVVSQPQFVDLTPADDAHPYSCRVETIRCIRRKPSSPFHS